MADQDDVRRITLALPGTVEAEDRFAFSVLNKGKWKGIAWVWLERVEPKRARVPRPDVVAIRVSDQEEKEALIAADPERFFTEPTTTIPGGPRPSGGGRYGRARRIAHRRLATSGSPRRGRAVRRHG